MTHINELKWSRPCGQNNTKNMLAQTIVWAKQHTKQYKKPCGGPLFGFVLVGPVRPFAYYSFGRSLPAKQMFILGGLCPDFFSILVDLSEVRLF